MVDFAKSFNRKLAFSSWAIEKVVVAMQQKKSKHLVKFIRLQGSK
jgi:hypothetical protein